MVQPRLQPFAATQANLVEATTLIVLLVLSSFNVASQARVTGKSSLG
jgi:hypothetical protein